MVKVLNELMNKKTLAVIAIIIALITTISFICYFALPTPEISPTPEPTPEITPIPTVLCQIGVPYKASDGLTVTLDSLMVVEKSGSYQYIINYTLKNENSYEIDEGSFKMYYKNTSGGLPQYGFFNSLFPDDVLKRSYTFEELKNNPFGILEYAQDNFFNSEPSSNSLRWQVVIP